MGAVRFFLCASLFVPVSAEHVPVSLLQEGIVMMHNAAAKQAKTPSELEGCRSLTFLHIPKNAGTAIISAAEQAGVAWNLPELPSVEGCYYNEAPPSAITKAGWPNPYQDVRDSKGEIFCLKRDPYSRIVSEFRYRQGQIALGMKIWGIGSLEKYSCTDDGLNGFVQEALSVDNLSDFHANETNCHLYPQSRYTSWCSQIISVEQLPESFDQLMQSRDCPIRLGPKVNEADGCPDVTTESLTAESKRLIKLQYREDFRSLGYAM